MKLRQLPEDFKVEELNEFDISKDKGDYKLYVLEKKGLETFSMLGYLSKKNKIPVKEFGIAGLKDRHAITKQYFTVPSKYDLKTLQEKNLSITFLGYVEKKLSLGDLKGNRFEIVVRDVKKGELEGVSRKAETLPVIGVPNYFDSQRFGSAIHGNFIAKHLLKKDYEQAVKIYLTAFSRFESGRVKQEKKLMLKNWDRIPSLNIKYPSLAVVVEEYKKTRSWIEAYKRISPSLREMMVSAYQSYLWNECVKEILNQIVNRRSLYGIKYNIGSLLFYKSLSEDETGKLPETFKTISDQIEPTSFEQGIINKILGKEGITIKDFNIKNQTGNFFKTSERKILLKLEMFCLMEHPNLQGQCPDLPGCILKQTCLY